MVKINDRRIPLLSDATRLNGCMYLLPANQDPDYLNPGQREHDLPLQSVRALPAKAGSVLLWNQNVYHWGGRASLRASTPRISIACEYQHADQPPISEPLLNPGQLPTFDLRSELIVRLLVRYRSFTTPSTERSWASITPGTSMVFSARPNAGTPR